MTGIYICAALALAATEVAAEQPPESKIELAWRTADAVLAVDQSAGNEKGAPGDVLKRLPPNPPLTAFTQPDGTLVLRHAEEASAKETAVEQQEKPQ